MFTACYELAACRNAELIEQSPQVGALVVLGLISALTTTALASTLGIFAFIRAVEQRYSPLSAATSHALEQPSQSNGMRRMVQFLNPQDWLNAEVRGRKLAAFASASLQGAGVFLRLLHFIQWGRGRLSLEFTHYS